MQQSLFEPPQKAPGERKAFNMADTRFIWKHYTSGTMAGREVATHLGHSYGSFKQFVFRNPELMKRGKKKGARTTGTPITMPSEAAKI